MNPQNDQVTLDLAYTVATLSPFATANEAERRRHARRVIGMIVALPIGLAIWVFASGTLHDRRYDSKQLVQASCTVQLKASARVSDLYCADGTHYDREFPSELREGDHYTLYYTASNHLVVALEPITQDTSGASPNRT